MIRCLAFLLLASMVPVPATAQAPIVMPDAARLIVADDPRFAALGFDDSAWPLQPVMPERGWSEWGAEVSDIAVWFRMPLDAADIDGFHAPALHMPLIFGGHAVYVNGQLIGSTGVVDPAIMGLKSNLTKALPRVYPIPKELIRADGDNVLAIRLIRLGFENAGPLAPIKIEETSHALAQAQPATAWYTAVSTLVLGMLVLGLVVVCASFVLLGRPASLGWILLALLLTLPYAMLFNAPMTFAGHAYDPELSLAALLLSVLAPIPGLEFAVCILRPRTAWLGRLCSLGLALCLVLSIPDLIVPEQIAGILSCFGDCSHSHRFS